jgi:hypothetical protein
MDVEKLVQIIYNMFFLSTRKVIVLGFLLPASFAVTFDMAFSLAEDYSDASNGGFTMIVMIQSWHFWVLIVSLIVMVFSAIMILKYANRTEQDAVMLGITSSLKSMGEQNTIVLDTMKGLQETQIELRDSIKELTGVINDMRKEVKDGDNKRTNL